MYINSFSSFYLMISSGPGIVISTIGMRGLPPLKPVWLDCLSSNPSEDQSSSAVTVL